MNMTTNEMMQLEVIANLPQVLLDYLWDLAASWAGEEKGVGTFTLRPVQLGSEQVQEILFQFGGRGERHRVFGFEPVSAVIQVHYSGGSCVLQVADEEEVAHAS